MKHRSYVQLKAVLELVEKNQSRKFLTMKLPKNSPVFEEVYELSDKLFEKLEAVEKMRLEVVNMKQVIENLDWKNIEWFDKLW